MNHSIARTIKNSGTLTVMALASLVLVACAVTPTAPPGAAETRSKLTALQNDPNLAERARVEIQEAAEAVRLAEQPLDADQAALGQHRVFMADRKVEIARAKATTRYAEYQRTRFAEERDAARLAARTLEADRARADATRARGDATRAQSAADAARLSESAAAAEAARRTAEFERQIAALEAEATERGLVLTLGDVLFATASAQLQSGASTRLNKLVDFLNQYPDRRVLIEGHTDNVGSASYNQDLSQRRADSVRSYLTQQGIAWQRMTASGLGLHHPIAGNDSAAGRQQNRRVEIIIENPPLAISGGSQQ